MPETPITITHDAKTGLADFSTVNLTATQMTFFRNTDSNPHQPVFTDGNINVAQIPASSGGSIPVSTPIEPGRALADGGMAISFGVVQMTYTCSLHPGESGVINIAGDFYLNANANQISLTAGQAIQTPIALTSGGAAPYALTNSTLPAGLSLNNTCSGITLSGSTSNTGNFTFTMNVTDAFQNTVDAVIIVTVSNAS